MINLYLDQISQEKENKPEIMLPRMCNGQRTVASINVVGKLDIHEQKNEIASMSHQILKEIHTRRRRKCNPETINLEGNLYLIVLEIIFVFNLETVCKKAKVDK